MIVADIILCQQSLKHSGPVAGHLPLHLQQVPGCHRYLYFHDPSGLALEVTDKVIVANNQVEDNPEQTSPVQNNTPTSKIAKAPSSRPPGFKSPRKIK